MKIAILGSGPSLVYFNRLGYDYVVGANDIYSKCPYVDAIAFVDPFRKVSRTRPATLETPTDKLVYTIEADGWKEWLSHRPFKRYRTRKWNGQYDADFTKCVMHGYHTPFFIASAMIYEFHKQLTCLDFYGIDGGGFENKHNAIVIKELNFLNTFTKVRLCKYSELWTRQHAPDCMEPQGNKPPIRRILEVGKI